MPALQLVPRILYLRADITLPHHTGLEHHRSAMLAQHMPQDIVQMAGRQENQLGSCSLPADEALFRAGQKSTYRARLL